MSEIIQGYLFTFTFFLDIDADIEPSPSPSAFDNSTYSKTSMSYQYKSK